MKAIVQDAYGSVDVLRLDDIDVPTIGDDDVLVRVHAAGVDPGVWHLMTGLPYLTRAFGFGLRRPKARVRGLDVAGTIEAVGSNVTRLQPGDEVFGTCDGSFAEHASGSHERLAHKPANLTFEQAAAVPVSGITALEALKDKARVQPGQRVLVIGAGGGVGTFAVQVAKAFGAEVTGVCSTSKVDLVRSIGADDVIDYTVADLDDRSELVGRFDVVIDTAGRRRLSVLRRLLTPSGTLVVVGGMGTGRWLGGTDRVLRAILLSPFVSQRLVGLVAGERLEELEQLRGLIEAGKITPVVERTYPLVDAAAAIEQMHAGHNAGKIVLTI